MAQLEMFEFEDKKWSGGIVRQELVVYKVSKDGKLVRETIVRTYQNVDEYQDHSSYEVLIDGLW